WRRSSSRRGTRRDRSAAAPPPPAGPAPASASRRASPSAPVYVRAGGRGANLPYHWVIVRALLLARTLPGPRAFADAAAPTTARMAAAWRALHPGQAEPAACGHPDPVRSLTADLDATPGTETVLASLRYGVILFGADG